MSPRRKSKQKRAGSRRSAAEPQPPRRGQAPPPAPVVHGPRAQAAAAQRAAPATPAKKARPRKSRSKEGRRQDSTPLSRPDLVWAGATAAISAILFATTLYSHPGLGDAPESVAGVSSLGVLHPPGYPAYVLAAWFFTLLVPFGTFALQVNLFSLVCASLSVAGVYLVARRCGAARWASALAGLALATGGAFWFYAGFAKHDMFSGLIFIAALYLLLDWQARPTTTRLVAFGVAVGIGLGSSWPLMVLLLPAAALTLFLGRRLVSVRSLGSAAAAGVLAVVALYGFVMVRAGQDPEVNWGHATNVGRLVDLIKRTDFTEEPRPASSVQEADQLVGEAKDREPKLSETQARDAGAGAQEPDAAGIGQSVGVSMAVFYNELGLAALALAAWGLFVSLAWRRGPPAWGRGPPAYALLVVFLANLIAAAHVVGFGSYAGFDTVLIQEGFLLGCYFVLAVWLAIGATDIAAAAAELGSPHNRDLQRSVVKWAAPPMLGLAVLTPSLLGHWDVPRRAAEPFADRYAQAMLSELPRSSVIFINSAERTQPLVYRQVVARERRDVVVVATDGLSFEWYRDEVARRLGRALPPRLGEPAQDARRAIESLRSVRPVYADLLTVQALGVHRKFTIVGMLARLANADGPAPVLSAHRLESTVRRGQRAAGLPDPDWRHWPNALVLGSYTTAALEVARAYFQERNPNGLRRALLNVLRLEPENQNAHRNLRILTTQGLPGG